MACIISESFDHYDSSIADYVSDDERAEKLQLQEVLQASFGMFHHPQSFYCTICMETKESDEMFKIDKCPNHSFCSHCISLYVQSKIQDKIFHITCPGFRCRAFIEPDSCKSIIPKSDFAKWEAGLSESTLVAYAKFYCPYRDCSELLIYDRGDDEEIVECVCPLCQRLFCAKCGAPWHTGLDCYRFQKEVKDREDDFKVKKLVEESKWMECPHCKNVVEKDGGCIHITCWCGLEFCYICGGIWNEEHWSCQTTE